MNEDLKSLLREECNFKPSDEVLDMFLDSMTEECVKPASRIIDYGRVNSDVYCLKKGIVRLFHVEDSKEKTFGFALPGEEAVHHQRLGNGTLQGGAGEPA